MNTLTDDDLTRALSAAADTFPGSEPGELADELRSGAVVVPFPRRRGVQLLSLAAALVVAVLVATSLSSSNAPVSQTGAGKALIGTSEGYDNSGTGGGGGTTGTSGRVAAPQPLQPGLTPPVPAGSAGSAGGASGLGSAGPSDAARIVQTGSISLVVDDGKVAQAMVNLRKLAGRVHGYVSAEQSRGIGDNPSGTITLRVPVASFDSVVQEITKGFGAKVVSAESSGKDVTAEYADTAAQIASLKAARGRYLTILNATKSVGEILSVQQRVDDVQGQIDRLEGARRVLANQSDLATLEVSVNEKAGAILNTEPTGWSKAWHDAGHGFTSGIQSLIAHSGRTLLVLILVALALLVGRSGWRLARRRLI